METHTAVFLPLPCMADVIAINEFIDFSLRGGVCILDARSQGEYGHGHVPGAINLPLLNNEERAMVGTTYKTQGHDAAVLKGFDLVGGKFGDYIRQANEICSGREVVLYCWRGGMRSSIMAWLLEKGGFKVTLIRGGYKSYRRWALNELQTDRKLIVLGGMTGSGKTELLQELSALGEQVIDLESMANHKGSAFGSLGQKLQPTIEQFENELAWQWQKSDVNKITWIENESRSIGSMILPANIYEKMQTAPMIEVVLNRSRRIERILNEYGGFPKDVLAANTKKLEKRLGGARLKEALQCLESDNMQEWVRLLLNYYDKFYQFGMELREGSAIQSLVVGLEDVRADALLIKGLADSMFLIHQKQNVSVNDLK